MLQSFLGSLGRVFVGESRNGANERHHESNLVWGPIGIACSIVFTVVAAMKHDLRVLLYFAWPCFVLGAWRLSRWIPYKALSYWATALAAISAAVGLHALGVWLKPSPISPAQQTPTVASSIPAPPPSFQMVVPKQPSITVLPSCYADDAHPYHCVSDLKLADFLIEEETKINENLDKFNDLYSREAKTQENEPFIATQKYYYVKELRQCCLIEAITLRTEALSRLGPAAEDYRERLLWQSLAAPQRINANNIDKDTDVEVWEGASLYLKRWSYQLNHHGAMPK